MVFYNFEDELRGSGRIYSEFSDVLMLLEVFWLKDFCLVLNQYYFLINELKKYVYYFIFIIGFLLLRGYIFLFWLQSF